MIPASLKARPCVRKRGEPGNPFRGPSRKSPRFSAFFRRRRLISHVRGWGHGVRYGRDCTIWTVFSEVREWNVGWVFRVEFSVLSRCSLWIWVGREYEKFRLYSTLYCFRQKFVYELGIMCQIKKMLNGSRWL